MKLSDLNPRWSRIYRDRDQTPDNGGFPTDDFNLQFGCPTCGPKYTISINLGAEPDAVKGRWAASPLPDGKDWPSRVTISPSIDHTRSGHGRRCPSCSFHGHIINGDVLFTQPTSQEGGKP